MPASRIRVTPVATGPGCFPSCRFGGHPALPLASVPSRRESGSGSAGPGWRLGARPSWPRRRCHGGSAAWRCCWPWAQPGGGGPTRRTSGPVPPCSGRGRWPSRSNFGNRRRRGVRWPPRWSARRVRARSRSRCRASSRPGAGLPCRASGGARTGPFNPPPECWSPPASKCSEPHRPFPTGFETTSSGCPATGTALVPAWWTPWCLVAEAVSNENWCRPSAEAAWLTCSPSAASTSVWCGPGWSSSSGSSAAGGGRVSWRRSVAPAMWRFSVFRHRRPGRCSWRSCPPSNDDGSGGLLRGRCLP